MTTLALLGGRVFDADARTLRAGDVHVRDGVIVDRLDDPPDRTIDVRGRIVSPGLVDSHLHIESSKLHPLAFCREAVRRGTTSLFTDPHEIANVSGRRGIDLWLELATRVEPGLYVGASSCVPASHLGDAGGEVTLEEIAELLDHPGVYGLAEMMNWPAILAGRGDYRDRVDLALERGKVVDGHFPDGMGADLDTYVTNGRLDGVVRIQSDHESRTLDEALQKLERGMHLMLRHGSAARNMEDILPGLLERGVDVTRLSLCSDDLAATELLEHGHVDRIVRRAREIIAGTTGAGLEEATLLALAMATRHAALFFQPYFDRTGLPGIGAIEPGRRADLVVFRSLEGLEVEHVVCGGRPVVEDGEYVGAEPEHDFSGFFGSVHVGRRIETADLRIDAGGEERLRVLVIGVEDGQLRTERRQAYLTPRDGALHADPEADIAKIAIFERHRATGSHAVGLVQGLGVRRGALASTVGHDCHNLLVVGMDDESMAAAANRLQEIGGGLAVALDGEITDLSLEIGGLMSTEPIETVVASHGRLVEAARRAGTPFRNPFMTMSFLALEVLPELKISNQGIVDVGRFEIVPLGEPAGA